MSLILFYLLATSPSIEQLQHENAELKKALTKNAKAVELMSDKYQKCFEQKNQVKLIEIPKEPII